MELIGPSVEYKDSFIEALREFQAADFENADRSWWRGLSPAELETSFEAYVRQERDRSEGRSLPEGYVAYTVCWLVDGGEYVGSVHIRHTLNEHLRQIGGHIGYGIRPSRRGLGYGTNILKLALPKAKALGIDRVLVTCDENNDASRRVIEKNGGVLENKVPNPAGGPDKLRFWIDLP